MTYPKKLHDHELGQSWVDAVVDQSSVNPFSFRSRVAVYKSLIQSTNQNECFGANNERNPLWGLIYQLQWQKSSGRLSLNANSDLIDPNSPWGYGNFTLSIIPFLGAIAAGTVRDRPVVGPTTGSRFDYAYGTDKEHRVVPEELEPAILDWCEYFDLVSTFARGDDDEPLRMSLWRAHKTSLDIVADKIEDLKPELYSQSELDFLSGWCRMVDLFAACALRTDHVAMENNGIDVLPPRALKPTDSVNNHSDLNVVERSNVESVLQLASYSRGRMSFILWLWRRMMRTRAARDDSENILGTLLNGDSTLRERLRVLRLLV